MSGADESRRRIERAAETVIGDVAADATTDAALMVLICGSNPSRRGEDLDDAQRHRATFAGSFAATSIPPQS
jgi:hypothetical protein